MKTINVKPIEVITLKFLDGVEHNLVFSSYAMMVLEDEFEGFGKLFEQAKDRPFNCGNKLIYAGMKAYNNYKEIEKEVTLEETKKIVVNMDTSSLIELFMLAAENINGESKEDLKKTNMEKMKEQKQNNLEKTKNFVKKKNR